MGKQKYTPDGGLKVADGDGKKRDHTKTGKKAGRKETRRLEAIARQVKRIQSLESRLDKVKDKASQQKKIARAQVVLQCIRGGRPQHELWAELKGAHGPKAAVDITAK